MIDPETAPAGLETAAAVAIETRDIVGGDGYDVATLERLRSEFTLSRTATGFTLVAPDLIVNLTDVEEVRFDDRQVFLEPEGEFTQMRPEAAVEYDPTQSFGHSDTGFDTVRVGGNDWAAVEVNKTLTEDTVLRFYHSYNGTPEVTGIGFDNDLSLTFANFFTLGGTDTPVGITTYDESTLGAVRVLVEIPVGAFFTGEFQYMIFANDYDAYAGNSGTLIDKSTFSEIEFFERRPVSIDGGAYNLTAWGYGSVKNSVRVSGDGTEITVETAASGALHKPGYAGRGDWLRFTVQGDFEYYTPTITFADSLSPYSVQGEIPVGTGAAAGVAKEYIVRLSDYFLGSYEYIVFYNQFAAGPEVIFSDISFLPGAPEVIGDGDWAVADYSAPGGDAVEAAGGDGIRVSGDAWLELGETRASGADLWMAFDYDVDQAVDDVRIGFGLGAGDAGTQYDIYGEGIGAVSPDGGPLTGYRYMLGDGLARMFVNVGANYLGAEFDRINVSVDPAAATPEVLIGNVVFYDNVLMVDGRPTELVTYGGANQDHVGAEVLEGGAGFALYGNSWKAMEVNATVTRDTWLTFDMDSDDLGEVTAIGFDDDLVGNVFSMFQLGGTDAYGVQDFRSYAAGDGSTRFEINVGAYYQGDFRYLAAFADDDADQTARATFSNIEIEERPVLDVSGIGREFVSWGGIEDQGIGDLYADRTGVTLSGSAWKAAVVNATVQERTWVAFDFRSTAEVEIAGIGLENDETPTAANFFQIGGTETWGHQDYRSYSVGDGWVRYEVNVGAALAAGSYAYLTLVADDDAAPVGTAEFANIEIYDKPPAMLEINGIEYGFLSWDNDAGQVENTADGLGVVVFDDAWKYADMPTISVDPRRANLDMSLLFTVEVLEEADVIGIGIGGAPDTPPEDSFFQLAGTETFGIQAENDLSVGDGPVQKLIRLGDHVDIGYYSRLTLAAGDDAGGGAASFTDVMLLEGASTAFQGSGGQAHEIWRDEGGLRIAEDADRYRWIGAEIDENTVLHFEFRAIQEGAVHAIGLDVSWGLEDAFYWQLFGTGAAGMQSANGAYSAGDGWVAYDIAVGQEVAAGLYGYVTFHMDHDDPDLTGDSMFRNVWLENVGAEDVDQMVF